MNSIVFLWADPRSMSTVIEPVMRERGDFECYLEHHLPIYHKLCKHSLTSLTSLAHGH